MAHGNTFSFCFPKQLKIAQSVKKSWNRKNSQSKVFTLLEKEKKVLYFKNKRYKQFVNNTQKSLIRLSMDASQMPLEMSRLNERLATLVTLVRSLAGMQSLMFPEITLITSSIVAMFALERLFPGVQPNMSIQYYLLAESFVTVRTGIRTFTGVGPRMFRQAGA